MRFSLPLALVLLVSPGLLAQTAPKPQSKKNPTPVYDQGALVVLGEIDKVIKEVNSSDSKHRQSYNQAIESLREIAKARTVESDQLPRAIDSYDQAIASLDQILEHAPEIRRLYNQQLDLIGEAVTTAKRMLLSVPDRDDSGTQAKLREIEYKMESLAAKIRDDNTPERWKRRYRAAFKMWMRVKEQLDRSVQDIAKMERKTRKQAVVVLEKLYSNVYETYMTRLAGYEFMRAARESYSMSRELLEKVSDVQRLKEVISGLDPGDFDDMFLDAGAPEAPVVVDLLGKIVDEMGSEEDEEPVVRKELESTINQYFRRHQSRETEKAAAPQSTSEKDNRNDRDRGEG